LKIYSTSNGGHTLKKDYSSARHIFIPNKKPKKSKKNPNTSLTRKQKAQNKIMASKRVIVEHAIGGMKAFFYPQNFVTTELKIGLMRLFFKLLDYGI
jgi:hypothetical protein